MDVAKIFKHIWMSFASASTADTPAASSSPDWFGLLQFLLLLTKADKHKKDLDKYPGMYAVSLKDALEGKEPEKVEDTTSHK